MKNVHGAQTLKKLWRRSRDLRTWDLVDQDACDCRAMRNYIEKKATKNVYDTTLTWG